MNMKQAVLDLTGCDDLNDLHKRIKTSLDFPEYYGENLDAFWDLINCDCEVEFVTVIGSESVSEDLKPIIQTIIAMFEKNKIDWADSNCPFDYQVIS